MKKDSVGIGGRGDNIIEFEKSKNIIIKTDELNDSECEINLNAIENQISIITDEILLESKKNSGDVNSLVYGEKLVEILRWLIVILKTHTHPPNGIAIPTFHVDADRYYSTMDNILNKNIRMK